MRVGTRLLLAPAALALMGVLHPSTASAQTDEERAAARGAATDGLRALEAGRYQEALDLCTRAEALMHAPTHLLLIARAQMHLGHLVEAQETYIKIQRDQLATDAPRAFVEAHATAADEQATLTPRVPTLKVSIEGASPRDTKLSVDGVPVRSALIGFASPINPGAHTLEAKSATAASDPITVTIAEGAKQEVTLTLKPVASTGTDPFTPGGDEPKETVAQHRGIPAGTWIGLGVGVAGLVAGTVFTLKNHSDRNSANALCTPDCPASERAQVTSFDNDANTDATLAWVAYGVGAAGLVAGAAILLFRGRPATPPSTALVRPWVGPRSAGIEGAF